MKKRLLALGATLAVLSGGCESEQKDVCSSATNISENVQCDVEDVITSFDTDNDERHPRDDRSPRTPGGSVDFFDEEDTTDDIDTIEDDSFDNDIIEEDTIIDYPLDPSMREDCSTESRIITNLIAEYETSLIMNSNEIIEGYEHMREILNRYNVNIFFKERVERYFPNNEWDQMSSSGYSFDTSFERFMIGTQLEHRTTHERRSSRSIVMTVTPNSIPATIEFTNSPLNDNNHILYTYNFRYDPNTNEMSGCSFEEQQPNITDPNTIVDNLCLDLCEIATENIPRYIAIFFESEYSQPAE